LVVGFDVAETDKHSMVIRAPKIKASVHSDQSCENAGDGLELRQKVGAGGHVRGQID